MKPQFEDTISFQNHEQTQARFPVRNRRQTG
jgi:hypothetical protein